MPQLNHILVVKNLPPCPLLPPHPSGFKPDKPFPQHVSFEEWTVHLYLIIFSSIHWQLFLTILLSPSLSFYQSSQSHLGGGEKNCRQYSRCRSKMHLYSGITMISVWLSIPSLIILNIQFPFLIATEQWAHNFIQLSIISSKCHSSVTITSSEPITAHAELELLFFLARITCI